MALGTPLASTTPNSQPSNVSQGFNAFNFQIPSSVTGSVGALSSVYSAYNQFQKSNPVLGTLSFAAALPHLQQAFPDTFNPEKYTDQGSKDLITGLNTGGQAAKGGIAAYGIYSNLQQGNYLGAGMGTQGLIAQGQQLGYLPDYTQQISDVTGLKPVGYGNGTNATTGFAPYATAPVAAYGAFQDFQNKNYVGGAINTAQAGQAGAQIYSSYFPAATATSAPAASGAAQTAPSLFGADTLSNIAAPIGVAGQAYRIGQQGLNAFNQASGDGATKGAQTGFKGSGGADMLQNLDPMALQARVFGGALGGIFGHKSIAKQQQDNWSSTANVPAGVFAANHAVDDTGVWQSGKYAGQKWSFDKALDLQKTEDPGTFQHVLGNYQTDPNYHTYSDQQQKEITSKLAAANLYASKHGDVVVTDKDAAKKIIDSVVNKSPSSNTAPTRSIDTGRTPFISRDPRANAITGQLGGTADFTGQVLQNASSPVAKVQANLKTGVAPSTGLSNQDFRNLYMRISSQGTLIGARA